jgi:ribonuclease VapC
VIVDSSALVAVVQRETSAAHLVEKLSTARMTGIGTPTLVETGIVLTHTLAIDARPVIARLLDDFGIVEVPFGPDHWREALDAFRRYGRGRHPARLTFGDCLTYAVARLADQPLLYVGKDFAATDLLPA